MILSLEVNVENARITVKLVKIHLVNALPALRVIFYLEVLACPVILHVKHVKIPRKTVYLAIVRRLFSVTLALYAIQTV
jgi:hypothetical protein